MAASQDTVAASQDTVAASQDTVAASQTTVDKFKWTDEAASDLVSSLQEYKTFTEFNGLDFGADKKAQYTAVRETMAKKYLESHPDYFGIPNINEVSIQEEDEADRKKIVAEHLAGVSKGYKRVQAKIKVIRQNFSKAVSSGTKSGSGKVVIEHYDRLIQIYGGCAATEALPFGVSTSGVNEQVAGAGEDGEDDSQTPTSTPEEALAGPSGSGSLKRKISDKTIQLVDNKRKHMEKELSAAQRDKHFIESEKDEKQFRQDMLEMYRESNKAFADSMDKFTTGMTSCFQMLAQAIASPAHGHANPANSTANPPPFSPSITEEDDLSYANL
jgi:hypothetical protein